MQVPSAKAGQKKTDTVNPLASETFAHESVEWCLHDLSLHEEMIQSSVDRFSLFDIHATNASLLIVA